MRINITAQADTREQVIRILQCIEDSMKANPERIGEKERSDAHPVLGKYGFTWEIVPDELEPKP